MVHQVKSRTKTLALCLCNFLTTHPLPDYLHLCHSQGSEWPSPATLARAMSDVDPVYDLFESDWWSLAPDTGLFASFIRMV